MQGQGGWRQVDGCCHIRCNPFQVDLRQIWRRHTYIGGCKPQDQAPQACQQAAVHSLVSVGVSQVHGTYHTCVKGVGRLVAAHPMLLHWWWWRHPVSCTVAHLTCYCATPHAVWQATHSTSLAANSTSPGYSHQSMARGSVSCLATTHPGSVQCQQTPRRAAHPSSGTAPTAVARFGWSGRMGCRWRWR